MRWTWRRGERKENSEGNGVSANAGDERFESHFGNFFTMSSVIVAEAGLRYRVVLR